MHTKNLCFILTILSAFPSIQAFNRSILRPPQKIPQIVTYWDGDKSEVFTLKDSHLEEGPIFKTFDESFFYDHIIPQGPITYRNNNKAYVDGEQLSILIEQLLLELRDKKKKFTDFALLKSSDFNFREFCGMLVLKFKDYPFVLKLFIE